MDVETAVEAWDFKLVPFITGKQSDAKSPSATLSSQIDHLVTQLATWDNTVVAVVKKDKHHVGSTAYRHDKDRRCHPEA